MGELTKYQSLKQMLSADNTKKRFEEMLGKKAAQETEIYNSYDILLHVYIQIERSIKIGWPIDKMDVDNSINYFLKLE